MVCITMDAHSRDIVQNMVRDHVGKTAQCTNSDHNSNPNPNPNPKDEPSHFQWQSQLKHKYRKSPPHAAYLDIDTHLRGDNGERAEVKN